MTDEQLDDLAQIWEWFGAESRRGHSPLYERIAASVACDPDILELGRQAPPGCHLPLSLLAAVHAGQGERRNRTRTRSGDRGRVGDRG